MVRGPDAVDLGAWGGLVPRSALVVPLDTHVHRVARCLALTRRDDASWRTAEEITRALARVDPEDPVRFDFALCHLGMSGRCPARRDASRCAACALLEACGTGRRVVARGGEAKLARSGFRARSPRA
jgi:endonuclease III